MRTNLLALVIFASSHNAWAVTPNTLLCSASGSGSDTSIAYFEFYPTSADIFTAKEVRHTRKLNPSDAESISTLHKVESVVSFGSRTGFNMMDGSWLVLSPKTSATFKVSFKDEATGENSFFSVCGFPVPVPGITANN